MGIFGSRRRKMSRRKMLFLEHKSLEISKAKPSFMLARVEASHGEGSLFVASHHVRYRPGPDWRVEPTNIRNIFLLPLTLLMLFPSGNTDIQNGNMKLILGLIWSLIAHYQLGASNFPPKKLMLAWLKVSINCMLERTWIQLPHRLQCTCYRMGSYFLFKTVHIVTLY